MLKKVFTTVFITGALNLSYGHEQTHSHSGSNTGHSHNLTVPDGLAEMEKFAPVSHSSTKFSFCVVADTQASDGSGAYNLAVTPPVIEAVKARNPLFTVFPGDLCETGNVPRWKKWVTLTDILGDNRYIVPGNHDLHPIRRSTMKQWQEVFSEALPWVNETARKKQVGPLLPKFDSNDHAFDDRRAVDYFVDHGNTRIVCVTTDNTHSENTANPPANLKWFRKVMQMPSTKAKTNVIVFTHKPLTIEGFAGNPDTGGTAWAWWRAISGMDHGSKKAAAIFTGHYHMYRPGRPDAGKTQTMEIITGTAGGGLEGYFQHRHHGFLEVHVDGDRISAFFWGDADGKENGWQFDDVLDSFIINPGSQNKYSGELTNYNFESENPLKDHSRYLSSKRIPLILKGAEVVEESSRGKVLKTGNGKFATTIHLKDHNLALTGDLSISVNVKARQKLTGKAGDNVILSYGCGQANGSFSGLPNYKPDERNEAENYAYILSVDPDQSLRLSWQYRVHRDDSWTPVRKKRQKPDPARLQMESAVSSAKLKNITEWNKIQVIRNAEKRTVLFYVNGKRFGNPIKFKHQATGAQIGTFAVGGLARNGSKADMQALDWDGFIDDIKIYDNAIFSKGQQLGDINFDGKVNTADLMQLQRNLERVFDIKGTLKTFSKGDLNQDGKVDQSDLKKFKALYN